MDNVRPLKALVERVTHGTGSHEPSMKGLNGSPLAVPDLDLSRLPARLDDATLAVVRQIADITPSRLPPCDEGHFLQCMRVLQASLPQRGSDDLSGSLMVAAYRRKLAHHPKEAISFLTDRVLDECEWFPTIAKCVEIIGRWSRGDDDFTRHAQATVAVRREVEARFAEAIDALEEGGLSQAEIDALPDQWKRIAAERCLLWHHDDGTFSDRTGKAAQDEKQAKVSGSRG